jgi:hypothetical protein
MVKVNASIWNPISYATATYFLKNMYM